jgi:uncharacterized Zn-finger protein
MSEFCKISSFLLYRRILYPVLKIDGKYQYKCCACTKVFHQLSNLKAHWRTHSGERPFKCHKCQKPFVQRAHLLKHLPTHRTGKFFSCSLCSLIFTKASSLANHRRLHSKEIVQGTQCKFQIPIRDWRYKIYSSLMIELQIVKSVQHHI